MRKLFRRLHPFTYRARNAKKRARYYNAKGEFSKWTIENLYVKQRGKCTICKEYLFGKFEVDHIKPLVKGGTNKPENLQLLCQKCNRTKGAKCQETQES